MTLVCQTVAQLAGGLSGTCLGVWPCRKASRAKAAAVMKTTAFVMRMPGVLKQSTLDEAERPCASLLCEFPLVSEVQPPRICQILKTYRFQYVQADSRYYASCTYVDQCEPAHLQFCAILNC